jgi:hypothetical protein
MKALHATLLVLVLVMVGSPALAATLTVSGNVQFSSLDGSGDDADPTPGVFAYNGDLVIDGTISCNDDPPRGGVESACPISIRVAGNLTMDAGSAIFAENRRGAGSGGDVTLDVGGNLALHGPDASLAGAVISSSRPSGAGPQPGDHAGNIRITVGGTTTFEAGSTIAASALASPGGAITVSGQGAITIGGLVASGPSRDLASTRLSGTVLTGGSGKQVGGPITITSASHSGPGVRITTDGVIVSQGLSSGGAGRVQLEACGVEIRGLVASVAQTSGAAEVVLRSGGGLLISGQDLGASTPNSGRLGRVRADSGQGGTPYRVALFARGDLQVLGPAPAQSQLSAVSSDPGSAFTRQLHNPGT